MKNTAGVLVRHPILDKSPSEEEGISDGARLSEGEPSDESSSDANDSESETEVATNDEQEDDDAAVLSHKQQRKEKKKRQKQQKAAEAEHTDSASEKRKGKQPVKNTAELAPSRLPKRQNSVWVGNLTFKTTAEALRRFFDGAGEITRIHMPMKMASAGPGGGRARQENRGFAYVDFSTPDAKTVAITLSENPLDGRRLLIKDGDDFNGRPTTSAAVDGEASTSPTKPNLSGHSKTAQKILRVQKQPAGPTLFLGNLGFETTEQSIRQLFASHRQKPSEAEEDADKKPWIRKVRMGTFEDSGKCKGWAFVDFTTPEHATTALTNPKNHFLDGRKLVLEYASPDAVRRGGNIPRSKDIAKGEAEGKGKGKERQPKSDGAYRADEASGAQRKRRSGAEAEPAANEESTSPKRRRVDDGARTSDRVAAGKNGKPPRVRPKPGAALAQARRETAAIVPAQGQKIVF